MPVLKLPHTGQQMVSFYDSGENGLDGSPAWYNFANYSHHPVTIYDDLLLSNINWPTTEHYFQAQKISAPTARQRFVHDIAKFNYSANDTRAKINQYNPQYSDWHKGRKEVAMLNALRTKMDQYPDVKALLLSTGDMPIVEDTAGASYRDDEWGCGYDGNGRNKLGLLLMQLREEYKGLNPPSAILKAKNLNDIAKNALSLLKSRAPTPPNRNGVLLQNYPGVIRVQHTLPSQSVSAVAQSPQQPMQAALSTVDPQSAIGRVLTATHAQNVSLIPDIGRPGKEMVRLEFSTPQAAQAFSKKAGGAPTDGQNAVLLGENRAEFIFKQLGISTHGKANPRPMLSALMWEINQSPHHPGRKGLR